MNIRQAVASALVVEREPFVVEAQQVQKRRLKIMYVHGITGDIVSKRAGFAVNGACVHPSAGNPHRKTSRMMIATVVVYREFTL